MPRKTKDIENEVKTTKNVEASTTHTKKTTTATKSKATAKSVGASTTRTKKTTKNSSNDEVKKSSTSKKSSKNASTKKSKATTKSVEASTTRPKKPTKNSSRDEVKKSSTSKKSSKNTKTKKPKTTAKSVEANTARPKKMTEKELLEYYDLPYRYNETIVKILAQTPKKLFVYWDISDADRQNYINKFGADFFNNTKPVLLIHNNTMNYTFEVEINDFANCWYLNVNDTKCNYTIELGRRSKFQDYYIPNNYIYVSSSNVIESPNDHILFENHTQTVYFRNVKNNSTYSKDIANLSFIRRIGKIYNIYDAYKKLYSKIYNDDDIIDINNPSSNNPTSTFK